MLFLMTVDFTDLFVVVFSGSQIIDSSFSSIVVEPLQLVTLSFKRCDVVFYKTSLPPGGDCC